MLSEFARIILIEAAYWRLRSIPGDVRFSVEQIIHDAKLDTYVSEGDIDYVTPIIQSRLVASSQPKGHDGLSPDSDRH